MRERWIETELFGLRQELGAGDFSRRLWREQAKGKTEIWRSMPLWFRQEAMPYINPNWKPKAPKMDEAGILDAIDTALESKNGTPEIPS